MAASGVNVLRWSALFAGVVYGIYHQGTLSAQARASEASHKYHKQEDLIAKAKAEYLKRTMPRDKLTAGGGVITDPEDPKFDLEAYLTMNEAGQK